MLYKTKDYQTNKTKQFKCMCKTCGNENVELFTSRDNELMLGCSNCKTTEILLDM